MSVTVDFNNLLLPTNPSAGTGFSFLKEIVVFPLMSKDFSGDRMKKEAHLPSN